MKNNCFHIYSFREKICENNLELQITLNNKYRQKYCII